MASLFSADYKHLAWNSTSLLQQESILPILFKRPHQSRARLEHSTNRFLSVALSSRSRGGSFFQNPKSLNLKGSEGRPFTRVVAQAGRSRPKLPQPIRTHRRRRERPLDGRQPDPAGNIHKHKPDTTKEPEPYIRHPDDYYKYGPYGPYDYKAGVVGTAIPVTSLTQEYAFMWSSIKDLKEQEQADIHNACVRYDNRVQTFDASKGLKFFYVFVRVPFYVGPEPPWKQWTLVSEITVESSEDLDKMNLISRLNDHIRNRITRHTGWFRPDLIYVKTKRRRFQIRFEPEMEFIAELRRLLMESAGEPNEKESYYGVFCGILGLDVNARHEDVTSRYEESPEETQLACLEHLLSKHPVELLHRMPYPNRGMWAAGQSSGDISKTSNDASSMSPPAQPRTHMIDEGEQSNVVHYYDDEGLSESDEDEDKEAESEEDWDDLDDPEIRARMRERFSQLKDDEPTVLNGDDYKGNAMDSEDEEEFEDEEGEVNAGDVAVSDVHMREGDSVLKAAARPYSYVNLIREMVMLREMLLQKKRRLQQIEAGQL
eukprot:c22070_g3_i1 orf=282-1910(-)